MKKQKKTSHIAMPKNYSDCKGGYHLALFHLEDAKAALLDGGGREVKVFE